MSHIHLAEVGTTPGSSFPQARTPVFTWVRQPFVHRGDDRRWRSSERARDSCLPSSCPCPCPCPCPKNSAARFALSGDRNVVRISELRFRASCASCKRHCSCSRTSSASVILRARARARARARVRGTRYAHGESPTYRREIGSPLYRSEAGFSAESWSKLGFSLAGFAAPVAYQRVLPRLLPSASTSGAPPPTPPGETSELHGFAAKLLGWGSSPNGPGYQRVLPRLLPRASG